MAFSGRLGVEAALVGGSLVPGDVEIADGRVVEVGLNSTNGRGIAAHGFVDLQVNGFAGVDFFSADADGYRRAGETQGDGSPHKGQAAHRSQPSFRDQGFKSRLFRLHDPFLSLAGGCGTIAGGCGTIASPCKQHTIVAGQG